MILHLVVEISLLEIGDLGPYDFSEDEVLICDNKIPGKIFKGVVIKCLFD